ncbi:MAG: hypothetical protein CVU55_08475 [Deltaproteobacteria bacterium HGW-Deltaproteobacteria-13]|jgi:hypothetical protein|nr:MAG: hypothetical protein CVU55_08475 [Deltaproteobacteria bacterium HGW-Deltaproteobacteria-13]
MKLLYFFYCILKTDRNRFLFFLSQSAVYYKKTKLEILVDIFVCIFRHETMPLDYFYYKFIEMTAKERSRYTSRLLMYRFQNKFNHKNDRKIFKNKNLFYINFKSFVLHENWNISQTDSFNDFLKWISEKKPDKIVLKDPLGQVGSAVLIFDVDYSGIDPSISNVPLKKMISRKIKEGYTLAEAYVPQHHILMNLYPGSLNTVRITSFLHANGDVELLYAILRIGFDKPVDNFDAGGISALIDLNTGVVIGKGVFKNPFKSRDLENHPVTNSPIPGLQIPYWQDILDMIKSAAMVVPSVRTVGWDVVITNNGPALLEGNDNWDKTHWECCENSGMKEKVLALYNEN